MFSILTGCSIVDANEAGRYSHSTTNYWAKRPGICGTRQFTRYVCTIAVGQVHNSWLSSLHVSQTFFEHCCRRDFGS
jgi:hypothetical protein